MHLDIPHDRVAPPDLMARLRETDPTALLIYNGGGSWALWHRPEDAERRARHHRTGYAAFRAIEDHQGYRRTPPARTVTNATLRLRGYEWEADYEVQGEPTGYIAEHFAARRWAEQRMTEAQWDALIAEASGDVETAERKRRLIDACEAEARSIDAIITRKRVSVIKATRPLAQPTAS